MIHRIASAALAAAGLWLTLPASVEAATCRHQSPEVFVLTGEIDRALADCVARLMGPATREVILTSRGGSVTAALDIAERFEGRGLIMRVRDECNSSCANYFLPLASQLIVERGAIIGLHGSIDPLLIDNARARGDAVAAVNATQTAQRQMAFARRNGIPPGWLLYRLPGETRSRGLDGDFAGETPETRMFIVEEAMARACLPKVTIVPYQADLRDTVLRRERQTRLHRSGIARSNDAICNAVSWDDFPPPQAVG